MPTPDLAPTPQAAQVRGCGCCLPIPLALTLGGLLAASRLTARVVAR